MKTGMFYDNELLVITEVVTIISKHFKYSHDLLEYIYKVMNYRRFKIKVLLYIYLIFSLTDTVKEY